MSEENPAGGRRANPQPFPLPLPFHFDLAERPGASYGTYCSPVPFFPVGAPPREHDRARQVAEASAGIGVELNRLQREHGLTTTEMLQAVGSWQMTCLKYMLRAERHPDNPDEPADWE